MRVSRRRLFTAVSGAFVSVVVAGTAAAQDKDKKEYQFKGKVQRVDQKAKTVTVANENVPGWMMAMTMSYGVDKDVVLKDLKVGDQITATVYQDNYKTLYNLKVVPPEKKK